MTQYSPPSRVADGVDKGQWVALPLVLNFRQRWIVEVGVNDVDDTSREEALLQLVDAAKYGDSCVATHATTLADGERLSQLQFRHVVGLTLGGCVYRQWCATHEPSVRDTVIVALEEDSETLIDVVQRADVSEMVEASLPQGPPKSLMLISA